MGAKAITVPERKRPPGTLAPRAAPRLSWAPTAGTEDGTAMQPERFGRYEVVAEIGDGAMGRVYKARDPVVQRFVAIKTIKSEYLTRDQAEEYLKRFRREAQAAGSLTHIDRGASRCQIPSSGVPDPPRHELRQLCGDAQYRQ